MSCPSCPKGGNYLSQKKKELPHRCLSSLPFPGHSLFIVSFVCCLFVCGYLDVFHSRMAEAMQREAVTHARVQAVMRRMQQHVRPADGVVVPPGVEARELWQGGPRLGQERAGFGTHFLTLPLPPGVLLGLVQWVQGVGIVDVGVGVLALVVGERLVGGREVGRLKV